MARQFQRTHVQSRFFASGGDKYLNLWRTPLCAIVDNNNRTRTYLEKPRLVTASARFPEFLFNGVAWRNKERLH